MQSGATPWNLEFATSRRAAQQELGRSMEILHPIEPTEHNFLRDCAVVCVDHVDAAVEMSSDLT